MKYAHLLSRLLILLAADLFFLGCSHPANKVKPVDSLKKQWNQTIPRNFSGQTKVVFDSAQISDFLNKYPGNKVYSDQIRDFYQDRKYAYAWFNGDTLIEQADNLVNRMTNLQNEGVFRQVPYKQALDSLWDANGSKVKQAKPDVTLELMLTSQYFAFSKLAWNGMNASASKANGWYLPRKKLEYDQYLDSILKAPASQFLSAEPVYRQYELLRGFLRKYRALNASGIWPVISIGKKALKFNDSAAVIAAIKRRLFQLEDFRGDTVNRVYNKDLMVAVAQFQNRHGLQADSMLNKQTLATLNVPLKKRISQIIVNMERCRWLPVSIDGDYLAINIPEFKMHVYHADSLLWSCDVVVGQTTHPTTVFYGEIKYVVFSPYWNIPPSIVSKEVLPGIKKEPDYLENHHMEVTGHLDGLPVVRQKPGPTNSLGLVKFLFPNSYNIYLHDTPSKSLFGESARAFSHGCIRVREPGRLAAFLLKNDKQWNPENIKIAMHTGKEHTVTLGNKVPVFIAYLTAFAARNHQLNFRDDVYNLDERLAAMIFSGKGAY